MQLTLRDQNPDFIRLQGQKGVHGLRTAFLNRPMNYALSRREALVARIDENLLTLRSLELQHQAQDCRDVLHQALNIAIRVQKEVHHLS